MPAPHPDCSLPGEEIERQYSPSSMVGGSAAPFVADYIARSGAVSAQLGDRLRVLPDGSRLVLADRQAPLFVFVHGGYWQALSAAHSVFPAPGFLARGWSYAAVEYTIAPQGTVSGMVEEVRRALPAVVEAAAPCGRVVVAGHSAGAHLAAMTLLAGARPCAADEVLLVSGVFDLRPVQMMSVNEATALTAEQAAALSPALLPVVGPDGTGTPRVTVTWGGRDTPAFGRQSRAFAARLRVAGLDVDEWEQPERHHFDILDTLTDICRAG